MKYQHYPFLTKNLSLFLGKLQAKKQSDLLLQARQTVIWFYRLQASVADLIVVEAPIETPAVSSQPKPKNVPTLPIKDKINIPASTHQPANLKIHESITPHGCSWESVFDDLNTEIKLRHYSPKTFKSYRGWVRHFQTFTKSKDHQTLTQQDVVDFLSHLAVKKQVSASTQNQAFNALLFLYKHVLKRAFGEIKGVARAKRRPYIPVVLSSAEIDLIFDQLEEPIRLAAQLLYGCGLRLFECLKLRVGCLNFDAGVLTVHDGKGQKDRTVPLPQTLIPSLKKQLDKVFHLHDADLKARYAGTFLPDQLDRKYPKAAQEISWQWLFPAQSLTLIPEVANISATISMSLLFKKRLSRQCVMRKSLNVHLRIPSGIHSPVICWLQITIFALFRNY